MQYQSFPGTENSATSKLALQARIPRCSPFFFAVLCIFALKTNHAMRPTCRWQMVSLATGISAMLPPIRGHGLSLPKPFDHSVVLPSHLDTTPISSPF
jgi:hypothetical protein